MASDYEIKDKELQYNVNKQKSSKNIRTTVR